MHTYKVPLCDVYQCETEQRIMDLPGESLDLTLTLYFTDPASVQLYFERFWFRCWRCLDFEPVLTVVHSLLTLLIQVVEGQDLQDTHTHRHILNKGEEKPPFTFHKDTSKHPCSICLVSQTLLQ